jgi:hypothetical protein
MVRPWRYKSVANYLLCSASLMETQDQAACQHAPYSLYSALLLTRVQRGKCCQVHLKGNRVPFGMHTIFLQGETRMDVETDSVEQGRLLLMHWKQQCLRDAMFCPYQTILSKQYGYAVKQVVIYWGPKIVGPWHIFGCFGSVLYMCVSDCLQEINISIKRPHSLINMLHIQ